MRVPSLVSGTKSLIKCWQRTVYGVHLNETNVRMTFPQTELSAASDQDVNDGDRNRPSSATDKMNGK